MALISSTNLKPLVSPSTFAGLLVHQVLVLLLLILVPMLVTAWLRDKWPRSVYLGWLGMLGVCGWIGQEIFLSDFAGLPALIQILMFPGGFILLTAVIEFLRFRGAKETLFRSIGFNAMVILGSFALAIILPAPWRNSITASEVHSFGGPCPLATHCPPTISYQLGSERITVQQAQVSWFITEAAILFLFVSLSFFRISISGMRSRIESDMYRLQI